MKQSPSILVVDDEAASANAVAELLKNGGYTVTTASDGFKALAACKVRVPDMIVLDLYMPLMNGADVFNRLRAEEKTKYIPIILMKKREEPDPALDKALLEDTPMLTKPLETSDIVTLAKTILREKFLRDELRKKEGQLKELELVDRLTSFRNARFLTEFLKTELPQCQRYQTPLSLLLIEPDQYREVQKAHGVKGADSIILQLAVVLSRNNRRADLLARCAPTEFAMVLTHTDRPGAIEVAERLRNTVQQSTFTVGEAAVRLSVTIGVSIFSAQMDTEGQTLLAHARAAVAQGRSNGGNVTLIAE